MTHEDAIAHHAQQAAALRRERDEERASRLAILERLTPACEMLLAKGDVDTFNVLTGNGMHVPLVRRDVVAALREARAARDAKVRTERDNAWLSALETETVCAAPLTPRGMFDAVTSHDAKVRAAALEEAAHHFRHRATVAMELRTLVATPSAASAPSQFTGGLKSSPLDAGVRPLAPATERAKCDACGGHGQVETPGTGDGDRDAVDCDDCGGTGEVK